LRTKTREGYVAPGFTQPTAETYELSSTTPVGAEMSGAGADATAMSTFAVVAADARDAMPG